MVSLFDTKEEAEKAEKAIHDFLSAYRQGYTDFIERWSDIWWDETTKKWGIILPDEMKEIPPDAGGVKGDKEILLSEGTVTISKVKDMIKDFKPCEFDAATGDAIGGLLPAKEKQKIDEMKDAIIP